MKRAWMMVFPLTASLLLAAACGDDDERRRNDDDDDGSSSSSVGGAGGAGTGGAGAGGTMVTTGTGGTMVTTGTGGGSADCFAGFPCSPLIPGDCDDDTGAGSACDVGNMTVQCYGPPNTQMLGQACSDMEFCAHGLACIDSVCVEWCCTQADCTMGTCTPHPNVPGGPSVCTP